MDDLKTILTIELTRGNNCTLYECPYTPIYKLRDKYYLFVFSVDDNDRAIVILEEILDSFKSGNKKILHLVNQIFLLTINDIKYLTDKTYIRREFCEEFNDEEYKISITLAKCEHIGETK